LQITQIQPSELKRKLDNGEPVYLVDVRFPEENAICRLPESLLIPLPDLESQVGEVTPPENALVVVYCHHGVRSLTGAAILTQAGITNVASLAGGIDAWSRSIDPTLLIRPIFRMHSGELFLRWKIVHGIARRIVIEKFHPVAGDVLQSLPFHNPLLLQLGIK
jgi:rhodanese-related sulfurtransferase